MNLPFTKPHYKMSRHERKRADVVEIGLIFIVPLLLFYFGFMAFFGLLRFILELLL